MSLTRRTFLEIAASAAATGLSQLGLSGVAQAQGTQPRLNLLLITADDLNADSMGWMGSTVGATPHLDAFAASSHCFAHTHGSAPICQPSREALMTGRVPHRNGGLGFDPINPDVPTLTETLNGAGYFSAAINKLTHMAPAGKFPWQWSIDHGTEKAVPANTLPQDSARHPDFYAASVTQAIQKAKAANQPFFINANIVDPHRPFYGTPADAALAGARITPEIGPDQVVIPPFLDDLPDVRREVTQYFNSVHRLDASFGAVLSALEASGQAQNTVVAFISDHGMAFPFAKATIYQNGTWTPLLLRAPGVAPTVDRDHIVGNVDVMPTLLEMLGVPTPPAMDGRSLLPLIQGREQAGRDFVITHINSVFGGSQFPSRCVRTTAHSYIWNPWSDGQTKYNSDGLKGLTFAAMTAAAETDAALKARVQQCLFRTPHEFYDLKNDPGERRNLMGEAERRDEIARLQTLLLAHMKATGDPLLSQFPPVAAA